MVTNKTGPTALSFSPLMFTATALKKRQTTIGTPAAQLGIAAGKHAPRPWTI